MDTPALIATLTTTLAIGLTIVLLRILRQERQRSEARVAALVTLSAQPAAPVMRAPAAQVAFEQPPVRLQPRVRPAAQSAAASQPLRREVATDRPPAPKLNAANIDIFRDSAPALHDEPAHAPALFDAPAPRATNSLFYIGAGALTLAALIALSFGWAFSGGDVPAEETTASIAAGTAAPAPLALLALRHEQGADGTRVISGVVRNPADAAARQKLFAAASLVDAEGALVATARAPLDFTILEPGEESPFVVRVTGATGVARYRIGFRDADGASVAHLDKR